MALETSLDFGDAGEPIQPYCLHFLALHNPTSIGYMRCSALLFEYPSQSGGSRVGDGSLRVTHDPYDP